MLVIQVSLYAAIVCIATILVRRFRLAGVSLLEPGVIFGAFVLAYSVIPLLAFSIVNDIASHPQADVRLNDDTASPKAVSAISWLHLWFFACFTLAYLALRKKSEPFRAREFHAGDLDLAIGAALLTGCKLIVWLGLRHYDISAANYLEAYAHLNALPLLTRQILTHVSGLATTLSVLLCVGIMSRRKYHWILPIWLGLEAILLIEDQGSRTAVFVICLSILASYHYLVRKISALLVLILLGVAFLMFVLVGAWRDMGSEAGSIPEILTGMLIRNEFTSVFINALDVQRLRDAGMTDAIVPQFYFSDLVNVFPQQFLPLEKLDVSAWYVQSFYPEFAALGGGYVFGIISESIVGLGYLDAGVRALLLGILFASVYVWIARKKRPSLWMITFYIWLLVLSFKLFRGTTLALVPVFILDFLPAYVVFKVARAITLAYLRTIPRRSIAASDSSGS